MCFLFDLKVSQEMAKCKKESQKSWNFLKSCHVELLTLKDLPVCTEQKCVLTGHTFKISFIAQRTFMPLSLSLSLSLSLFLSIFNTVGFSSPIDQTLTYLFSRFIQQMVLTELRFFFFFVLNGIICRADLSNYGCKLYFNETFLTRAIRFNKSETCYGILSSKFYFITLPCIRPSLDSYWL